MAASTGVLFIDAQERLAAATCRSLHAAGYTVGAAASARPAPGHWSLSCARRYTVPEPREDERRFADEIAAIALDGGYFTVLPGADASLLAISRNRGVFEHAIDLGLPPAEAVEACVSKANLVGVAARVGLPAPETAVCESIEAARAAAARFGLPVLVKPRSTVFEHVGRTQQRASFMAHDAATLERLLPDFGLPCLIQRREAGPLMSFGGVFADGRLLAAVLSRYRRVWPPDAGSVSFSESVDMPESLLARVEAFVGEVGWQGVFELELIERGGDAYGAIDFNPRVYGSLALAERAGVPLAAIWCDWLASGRADGRTTATGGFHYRWEDAELRNLFTELRAGRLRGAAAVIRPSPRCAHAYFRWNDPGPLLGRALHLWRRYREIRRERRKAFENL